jgi:signal transduction histidine kinase
MAKSELTDKIHRNQIHLTVNIAPTRMINVNSIQFAMVMRVIMENAVDAAKNSTDKSVVISDREQPEKATYQIMIDDSGPGFKQAEREKLFDPLYTTKHTNQNEGMGIGLSLVQVIVQANHWQIHSSRVASRTRFKLTIPTARHDQQLDASR